MGKKKKLNRLISRWIKSDLPDDQSPVLLLGVTRIPTSPKPLRRPCSLPLGPAVSAPASNHQDQAPSVHNRRNSGTSSRREILRRNSSRRREVAKVQTPKFVVTPSCQEEGAGNPTAASELSFQCSSSLSPSNGSTPTPSTPILDFTVSETHAGGRRSSDENSRTDANLMERSVDSIGTCSLDVDASVAESSDWSEVSSVGTLRSASLPTPSPEPRLPSYLSLACTVNGYSTTTNYDPDRLARSRDSSPHRPRDYHAQDSLTYATHNNLLSPPNLVPLPPVHRLQLANTSNKMSNNGTTMSTTHYRQEFYSNVVSYMSSTATETKNITSRNIFSSDSVDACIENGYKNGNGKCVTVETKVEEFCNGKESKSFIQQRVERLYGPGALAQGFFVTKKQKNKSFSETENIPSKNSTVQDKHSKSMNDDLLEESSESCMKQSTSSPSLPVLRHLRPEFRAQLPIIERKRPTESPMQKSVTVPVLSEEKELNGHSDNKVDMNCGLIDDDRTVKSNNVTNGTQEACDRIESQNGEKCSGLKNGHYFMRLLDFEVRRLLALADVAEEELQTSELPEEAKGFLRSASGKARLLVTQKMQQFKGLCTNNISQVPGEQYPTTNEDLQGFWDMIMLQVDQVNKIFMELDTLRENNWKEESSFIMKEANNKPRKIIKAASRPVSASAEENRKLREAQRKKMIEERRKAMKEQQQKSKASGQNIEIYVPESISNSFR